MKTVLAAIVALGAEAFSAKHNGESQLYANARQDWRRSTRLGDVWSGTNGPH